MTTSKMIETAMITPNLKLPPSARMERKPLGMAATTLAKIRMDIPCPMPRWVMSSASHMTKAVPAVEVPSRAESWPWKA
jgi:hypothetical protein